MLPELAHLHQVRQQLPNGQALRDDAYHDAATGAVLSVDCFVEGRHFNWAWGNPYQVGYKCAATALSDIAAMGAEVTGLLVGLTVGQSYPLTPEALGSLYQGLSVALALAAPGAVVMGGDWVTGIHWHLALTAVGRQLPNTTLGWRHQAQAGDVVLLWEGVAHGLSYLGCACLGGQVPLPLGEAQQRAVDAFWQPLPGYQAGLALAHTQQRYALMDTSDGLADAALKLAELSQVHLALDAEALTPHPLLRQAETVNPGFSAQQALLYGGEDMGLLATCAPSTLAQLAPATGWRMIGQVQHRRSPDQPAAAVYSQQAPPVALSYAYTYNHHATT
jgi:thiamine-monophosphate kinase